jgi:hypothetical protein
MTTVTKPCPECGTPVQVLDSEATGAEMRALREGMDLSGAAVGKAMVPPVTRAAISMMEKGGVRWTQALVERYKAALAKAAGRPR